MIPRMTTVGTLKNYRYNLNGSNNTMTKAMNTVLTRRLFNSYAEDPALATRCFQIRNSYWKTNSQLNVNESLRHKYDVAWEALNNMSTDLYALAEDTSLTSVIRSLSDPTGPGRTALGQSLSAKAQDLAQIMNGRYGENYVFAGADTLNAPFTWDTRKNPAYIEGEPDPANPKHAAAFQYEADPAKAGAGILYTNDPALAAQENGKAKENAKYNPTTSLKYMRSDGVATDDITEAAKVLHYRGVPVDSNAPEDVEKMEYFLNGEAKYIDVGLGHKETEDGVISSTVFDSSLQGLYYIGGYGTEDGVKVEITGEDGSKKTKVVDGIPNNIISVISEMGDILQRCGKDDGAWASEDDQFRFKALVDRFEDGSSAFRERWTEMDTQSGFLRDNSELLTDTADSLKQQYMELEDADPAAAISDFMFARYCYDAALKVGNSVLSQSLMDYMNF